MRCIRRRDKSSCCAHAHALLVLTHARVARAAYPILGNLPRKFQERVIAQLPVDVPLATVASVVADESYWKRRAQARWQQCKASDHGSSWKRLYFERHITEALESYREETMPMTTLLRTFAIATPFVRTVLLRQLPSHVDLGMVLSHLSLTATLDVQYGMRELGMDFAWGVLGITLTDVRRLAQALGENVSLRALLLQSSALSDEPVRILTAGLLQAPRLTHLDLAHNEIGDAGARALARYLAAADSQLVRLSLANNRIGAAGGEALGHALHGNTVLQELDLRMNVLHDGCAFICAGVTENRSLVTLNLAANRLDSVQSVVQLREMLRQNSTLTDVDISSNRIMSKLGTKLKDGIESNRTLLRLDVRATEISREAQLAIENVLADNLERFRLQTKHFE